jgi:hypothetical protein
MNDQNQTDPEQPTQLVASMASQGDPEMMLAALKRKAVVANELRQVVEYLIMTQTYPQDWTKQGDNACLGSAGAERIAAHFQIAFEKPEVRKEEWQDERGRAYRFVFCGIATLDLAGVGERVIYDEGKYGTRDAFLGKRKGEWRPLEDINENDIRAAAMHMWRGHCITSLLGIRNLPWEEYVRIMAGTGRDPSQTPRIERGRGTQGGTSADDNKHQKELAELCLEFANAAQVVEMDEDGNHSLRSISDADDREAMALAQASCLALSSFVKDGEKKEGKSSAKLLKGRWLGATLKKARKLKKAMGGES